MIFHMAKKLRETTKCLIVAGENSWPTTLSYSPGSSRFKDGLC